MRVPEKQFGGGGAGDNQLDVTTLANLVWQRTSLRLSTVGTTTTSLNDCLPFRILLLVSCNLIGQ